MMRYLSYNKYLKKLLGQKVYKICLDSNLSCPNRDGTKGYGGCIFCDEHGSSSQTNKKHTSIYDQVIENIMVRRTRYKAKKFIAYFQSFSNTHANISHLKYLYDEAVTAHPDIVGLSISTRSDCIDEDKIKLIASYKKILPYVCIEFGMQTAHDKTLDKLNRLEKHQDFLNALDLCKKYNVDVCAHVILGLMDETFDEIMHTADTLAKLKINGVKIHVLVVMKNTKLHSLYDQNKIKVLEMKDYIQLASSFIQRLHPSCIIYRTSGNGHPLLTIAPTWVYDNKLQTMHAINNELIKRETYQGSDCQYL